MSSREAKLLIEDIAEACEKIFRYTAEMNFDDFKADDRTSDAVIRNIEVIGEAANHLPDSYIFSHPEVGWNKAIAVRNRVIHEYFGVDYSIIWNIIRNYLPGLYESVKSLLADF
jgi:uncharacterized protein with HEPN domain